MKPIATLTIAGFLLSAASSQADTLVSSVLDNSQTDITGTSGIFSGTLGGDASAAVAGVTTTLVSTVSPLGGADIISLISFLITDRKPPRSIP